MARVRTPALAAVALALAVPGAADAATARLVFEEPIPGIVDAAYALSVEAAPGEANRISVSSDGNSYTVTDTGAGLRPGGGCRPVTASEVLCPMPRAAKNLSVFVEGGDGDDQLALGSLPVRAATEVRGGSGDDVIFGGSGHDLLFGGAGTDGLVGGSGFDQLDGGPGNDTLAGGSGTDEASYQRRRRPVSVDLAKGTGGQAGEADVLSEIEKVVGGRGADDLRGTGAADTLVGGEGSARDRAIGRGGDDILIAHRVNGGPGNDSVDGRVLSCGGGRDAIYRGTHRAPGPFPLSCEFVVAVFVVLRPSPIKGSIDGVVFALGCQGGRHCRGALELRDRRGVFGKASFSFRRGPDPSSLHGVRIRYTRRPVSSVVTLRIDGVRAYQRSTLRVRVPGARQATRSRSRYAR